MTQQLVNVGTIANDRTGDTWRAAMIKLNENDTELFAAADSIAIIFVAQESDFPLQDATTITLESRVHYIISAPITTAKSFTVKDAAVLTSSSTIGPTLTYTGVGSMFNGTDVSFSIRDVRINHPNAQGFNFTDTVGGTFLFLADKLRMVSGTKYGTFNNMQTVLIEGSAALDIVDGITITGSSFLIFSIDKLFMGSTSSSFIAVDLNSSISQTLEMVDLIVSAPSGAIGISGLANSGNVPVGRLAMVSNSEFGGGLTAPLQNILTNDIRWNFRDNTPIPDSRNAADLYLTGGTETITTGSAGDWQEIGVPGTGGVSWASDISDRFTIGTDGVATYIGEKDIEVRVSGRATVEKVGGGADVLEVRLALNWNGTTSDSGLEKSRAQTQNADPTTVPIGALIALTENDDIRVIFSNTSGTANIDASVSALEIFD